jgi:tRNA-dihydrouridine synthase C
MRIYLAPMEGLLDCVLRDILTRVGGVDRCVSEFIRVTHTLLTERTFLRVMPELLNGGYTPSGVPVRAQLLGSDPVSMAENAARLAELGPHGIDLNFGCPAKVVNRHGGGAALLQDPELLTRIVSAVRRAVPKDMPVSAKMRLGFNDDSLAVECAQALAAGGAEELVVHARTKADAYRPPAYWERVNDIRLAVNIPGGGQWRNLDGGRRPPLPRCEWLRQPDAGPGHRHRPRPGPGHSPRVRVQPQGAEAQTANAEAAADEADSAAAPLEPWVDILPLLGAFWLLVVAAPGEAASRPGASSSGSTSCADRYPASPSRLRRPAHPARPRAGHATAAAFGRTGW